MMNHTEEVMTLRQVADYFKVSEMTIHRLTQRGMLPGVKIGRQWRYFRQNIEMIVRKSQAVGEIAGAHGATKYS